jgi:predicted PurR-regulated permease PerM
MKAFGRALTVAAALALVALGVGLVVWQGRALLVVMAGVLTALALRGASLWVKRTIRVPYWAALAAVVVVSISALGLGLYFLGAGIYRQADALAQQLPQAWDSMVDALRRQPSLSRLVPSTAQPPAPHVDGERLLSGAGGLLEVVTALVLAFFIGLYGAATPDAYGRVLLQLVPPSRRGRADAILDDVTTTLTRWLGGRAIAMALVGVIVTIGLYALEIPLAGILGALAGWLTFVEYLGAVVSAAPALLLALSRGPAFVLGVGILFTVAHVLEGYIVSPLISRATVRIPPAFTLSSQIVMGSVFGVVGLTFATPILIVATVLVRGLQEQSRS